ncbi:MAG: universal stress protein [Actinomycetota bacterium]
MSTTDVNPPLVVGIDGSDAALAALDWAASEAATDGWPLRLVYAYDEHALLPMTPPTVNGGNVGEALFAEAMKRLDAAGYGGLDVSTAAVRGAASWVLLLEQAENARGLVVGREGMGHVAEFLLGSTALSCATHSRKSPVIVVPDGWVATDHGERVVTVGVDGTPRSAAAIEFALATASRWKARVVAVSAVRRAEPVLATAQPADAGGPSRAAERTLADALAVPRADHADVEVDEVVVSGHPAAVLKEHAAESDLIVIGGRGHTRVADVLLGSIARTVLHHADRPVAVVPEHMRQDSRLD